MKMVKVLCAMLVFGSPACELSLAAEAQSGAGNAGARNGETTHAADSTNTGAKERAPAPASDGRGASRRSSSDTDRNHDPAPARDRTHTDQHSGGNTGAGHDHAPASATDRGRTDRRSASDTGTEHDHEPAPATDRGRADRRSGTDTGAEHDHVPASARARAPTAHQLVERSLAARAGRPRQAIQSRGTATSPDTGRAPQGDGRIAAPADPAARVSLSRESVATANLPQRQRALPDFHTADRPIRGVAAAGVAGAVGGPATAGGPHAPGAAFVGGPPPAKIANSGTISGTAGRPKF
jgi:hypothetical protein